MLIVAVNGRFLLIFYESYDIYYISMYIMSHTRTDDDDNDDFDDDLKLYIRNLQGQSLCVLLRRVTLANQIL